MPPESTLVARGRSALDHRGRVGPSGRHRRSALLAGAVLSLTLAIATPLVSNPPRAGATSITSLRSRAAAIAQRIDTLRTKLQILSEEYDQARTRAAAVETQIRDDQRALKRTKHNVGADGATLRKQAIEAYVTNGSAGGLAVLTANPNALPMRQTYLAVASGGLDTAISSLRDSVHQLSVRRETLAAAEVRASRTTKALASARQSAQLLDNQLGATQSNVTGQLAAAVRAQEAAQQAAADQAAAATAQQAAAQPPPPAATPVAATPAGSQSTPTASGAGAAAVAAAESQVGVPYVWGGSTPGAGFDCSGLTMWAWGRAGVNLPHSAQEQYNSIEHISLSQLQPGDLIFYASGGYIYHVTMYIGGGQVVQAEDTGTVISITPVWPGAYAAGRP